MGVLYPGLRKKSRRLRRRGTAYLLEIEYPLHSSSMKN